MALRLKVLRTKAEKFERKEMLKFKFNLEQMFALDSILHDVYVISRPKLSDYEVRKDIIRVFNEIAKEIYGESNDAPVVEEFGSFSMDLFSTRSDLDMSVNFTNNGPQITREKKIQTLRKFAKKFYALQSKGHVTGVHPITTAKVPILKVVDRGTGVECDLSVENRDGILKSQLIHVICSVDERFQKLSFLMKTWAKAQNINSSKDGTLNSLSIILLVAFHLQTRRPPILPPFTALFKDGTDPASVMKLLNKFVNYGKNNKESVAELFVTLLIKLSSIERLWSKGLCVSVCEASWTSKTWESKVASISVEDFTDRTQNVSRAVGASEMKLIYKCIQHTIRNVLAFIDGRIEGSKLLELLFGHLPLVGVGSAQLNTNAAQPCTIPRSIHTREFSEKAVKSTVVSVDVKISPNVARPCILPCSTQSKGVDIIDGWEEDKKIMASNFSFTKGSLPVDGMDGWPCQQIEKAMQLELDVAKKIRHTEDWTATPDGWSRATSANSSLRNQFPCLGNEEQPGNNWGANKLSVGGDWNGPQQRFSSSLFGSVRENGVLAPNQASAAFRFDSVNTYMASFHASPASLPQRALPPKKKRKRFQ